MTRLHDDEPFVREVRRQAERARKARHWTVWQGLGMIGAVGWMVSVPAVLGALMGRWLDARFQTGIFWTLFLLVLGVALGSISAWRHLQQELKEP